MCNEVIGTFVDEEENDDTYKKMPPLSDNKGERNDDRCYESWRRRSGDLKISQVFESIKEFREAVLEYALIGGWNIQHNRWGSIKSGAKCGIEKCNWRVYCSYDDVVAQFMIKTFQDIHTCHKDRRCEILTEDVTCNMFIYELRYNPDLRPIAMQERIHERYNVAPSHYQCRKAKKRAFSLIEDEWDEQYSRTNSDFTVELRTVIAENRKKNFDTFYMCFDGLRNTWRNHYRPIFRIDGCFLKSNSKGQLLAAVGIDANNQIYPFAWAIVQVENTDSWVWFIQHLKQNLDLGNGFGFTLISDRQKGLLNAVTQELPLIEHRMCARHIYGNMKKAFPKKSRMKGLFWKVVESFNEADYKVNLKNMEEYDEEVHRALVSREPEHCSRAFFSTTSCCEDALNNFSESYNKAIEKARAMPLVQC
ncbi:uncharacterized protein LOC112088205 [Eutrema salsugineum]|uniref:uncharacterized protein LOC112088205 n=1 Tax=Eutrema salsugineum TaxID=72664 RepID=UPI000CECEE78|nr:uncharacterized protein LOC112088205 [Eutrema salsugineum]